MSIKVVDDKMQFDVELKDNGYEAKVVLDSVAENGRRLATVTTRYPRYVHCEALTHRSFSRNSASSRAIPWPKMLEAVTTDPVVPLVFGMEQSGMQTGDQLPPKLLEYAKEIWLEARDSAAEKANELHHIGRSYLAKLAGSREVTAEEVRKYSDVRVHKSIPNRITEPWMWITVVITATNYANFFRLRCHPDAEVHIRKAAEMIREALSISKPKLLKMGEWHLPFILDDERNLPEDQLKEISTARVARISYQTHLGVRDISKDQDLFTRLVHGSGHGHWSPHEMVNTPAADANFRSGPFQGWMQYRKEFPGENAEEPLYRT